jgi:hypothetical protein
VVVRVIQMEADRISYRRALEVHARLHARHPGGRDGLVPALHGARPMRHLSVVMYDISDSAGPSARVQVTA